MTTTNAKSLDEAITEAREWGVYLATSPDADLPPGFCGMLIARLLSNLPADTDRNAAHNAIAEAYEQGIEEGEHNAQRAGGGA